MALSSAFVQEGVNKVSSYLSSKLVDVASGENLVTRMEFAVSKLELAVERSGKLPITEASLLRQRKLIMRLCTQGRELLRMHHHHQLPLERREDVGQVVTSSSFLGQLTRAANLSISTLPGFNKGYLSSSAVKNFEQYAELADKFLEDVVSGCSLRKYMISNNPLFRLLLEGKTLGCITVEGTFPKSRILIWASHYEGRGVEASLLYAHWDHKMPEKDFGLAMAVRFSESTDIIGTAIKCLQPLVSQFKGAAEYAIGEISQQDTSNLVELSPWFVNSIVPATEFSHRYRSDTICCWSNEHGSSGDHLASSELAHICPEEVNYFGFRSRVLLEKKYSLRRSSDKASRSVMLPLKVYVGFFPHCDFGRDELRLLGLDGPASMERGTNQDYRRISIQEVLDTVGSTAMQSYLHRPELTEFEMRWLSNHGAAYFLVKKQITRRSGKRKR